MRKAGLFLVLVCAIAISSVEARATTAADITPEDQVALARAICIGRCAKIESRKVDGQIFTYITLDVSDVIKGRVTAGVLVIKQSGGLVGTDGEWIYGSPRFDVGRESLVFLADNGGGAYIVDGLFMGNFFLEKDADGRDWAMRDDGGEGGMALDKNGAQVALTMRLAVDEIRSIADRQAAKQSLAADVQTLQIPAEYQRPFEGESQNAPSFTLLTTMRWFEPDTGVVIPFYSNSTNFDSPQNLGAAVTDALAAWSTIDGCSLRMVYSGEDTGGCGWGPADHLSRVSVDCRGEISGTGCRSIIAVGGGHYTTRETIVVNGQTFYRITEGDVALNDGYCDLFQLPLPLREVITHEMGHNIGLGHSADHTATMAAFVHNDGRGASLKLDDMDGARFIYPGTPGGGNTETDPPVVATSTLPGGTRGATYIASLAVTNGKEPFEWSLTGGMLPPGVALSALGSFAGIPTLTGTYNFSVRVTDSLGRVDGKFLAIVVKVPPPVVASAAYKTAKMRLTVVGINFEPGAQFEINGQLTTPHKPVTFDPTANTFVIRGKRKDLHLNKGHGTNQIVVIVEGVRSQSFVF